LFYMTQTILDELPHPSGEESGAEHAARLLCAPGGLMRLSIKEARIVVRYMSPRFIPSGTTFIQEGDAGDGGFMALVIEGDVVVEQITVKRSEPITVRVLGPGALVGEMGLVDNEPRSASVTASSDVMCATLTRDAIDRMMAEDPVMAAKLLLSVSAHIAERLRNTSRQLKLYARLASAMQEEIDMLTRVTETATTRPPTQTASL
jgi:CRP/FNR family cyclic AMP-dependent transcriptional regulator